LIKMSTAILPFLNTLGRMLGGTLFQLGDFFARISKSPDFQKWLDSMTVTLTLVLELLGGLIQFITVFMSELDKAGGAEIIQTLIDAVEILTFFLASEAGQKAMEGLVHLAIASIAAFTGLLIAILFVIGALEAFAEWFSGTAIPAIGEFFEWIGSHLMAFFTMVGGAIMGFFTMVGAGIREGLEAIKNFFVGLWNSVTGNIGNLLATAKALPSQLLAALGDLGSLLFNAGRNLISGFINGIKSMANTLINTVANLIGQAMSFFPGSPAEQGPLSGQGYSLNRGQRMMEDFARGIESEVPTVRDASSEAVSNIFFGRDSVRVAFEGALPTQEQAQQTGMAVGSGINSQLAARNTRLAVRTL
jgi:phage-related protein